MKQINFTLLVLFILLSCNKLQAQEEAFICKWEPNYSNKIILGTDDSYTYNYDVDWDNDGVYDDINVTGYITHRYESSDDQIIRIKGDMPRLISFEEYGYRINYLKDILQWGDIQWESMERFFYCSRIESFSATDSPDLSNCTNLSGMLFCAYSFNGDLSDWDVSAVTNMFSMFASAESFNSDLSGWDVSNVTDMARMFDMAFSFKGDISGWDISNVTDMFAMFSESNVPTAIYNKMLINWSQLDLESNVDFDAGDSYYSGEEAKEARQSIIDNFDWTINDLGEEVVGIQEISESHFRVYPNPSTGIISVDGLSDEVKSIEVLDLKARVVFKNKGSDILKPQIELSPGIYIVRVNTVSQAYSEKLIVQ